MFEARPIEEPVANAKIVIKSVFENKAFLHRVLTAHSFPHPRDSYLDPDPSGKVRINSLADISSAGGCRGVVVQE